MKKTEKQKLDYEFDEFDKFLKDAVQEVNSWPEWKISALDNQPIKKELINNDDKIHESDDNAINDDILDVSILDI